MGVGNSGEKIEKKENSHIKSKGSVLVRERERERHVKTRVSATGSSSKGLPIVGNPKPTT